MLRRMLLPAIAFVSCARKGLAQSSLRPDPAPRLPPQPGQGLPAGDVRFLARVRRLSEAQVEAGRIAAGKASDPAVRELGAKIAEEQAGLLRRLDALAESHRLDPRPATGGGNPNDASLAALRQASGEEIDRRFLARELALYPSLAEMYQEAASNSPEPDIQRLGITALASLRANFETAQRLGARYDLRAETVESPPQY